MTTEIVKNTDFGVRDEGFGEVIEVESIHESIQLPIESIQWFSAAEAKHLTRLDQSGFTRAVKTLIDVHQIPVSLLRRGNARNTEYSRDAIDLIKLLNSEDREAFDKLKQACCSPTKADAIVLRSIDNRIEIASSAAAAANGNLTVIGNQLAALMDKYRRLGEVAGEEAGAHFKQGFTSGVARSIGEVSEV